MRRAPDDWDRGLSVGGGRIINLRYADDYTLLATNAVDLKELLLKVKAESGRGYRPEIECQYDHNYNNWCW